MKKIAVILSGSGYLDGSEIREAVAVLWALSINGVEVHCFAPDLPQYHVVDHRTASVAPGTRNVLTESARIARGKIELLSSLDTSSFDAFVMPGGFGAAKNLSTFAFEGAKGSVEKETARVIQEMFVAGKPIGAACIAPAVLALALRTTPLELTVGAEGEESAQIELLGHRHFITTPSEIHADEKHRIVTTPAYMYDNAPLHEVFEGIKKMVDRVLTML